jgi:hypothetical protein
MWHSLEPDLSITDSDVISKPGQYDKRYRFPEVIGSASISTTPAVAAMTRSRSSRIALIASP